MSKCFKCGTEVTLKEDETKCDNCSVILNFCCYTCNTGFSILDEKGKRRKECKACGFFNCPNCGICAKDCVGEFYKLQLKEFIPTLNEEELNQVMTWMKEIKLNKDQRSCPQGIPITYARERIKNALARASGYAKKSKVDKEAFEKRLNEILKLPVDEIITIKGLREPGNYGQEYRDVCNCMVCQGRLKIIKLKNKQGKEYSAFLKINNNECKYFDVKDLLIKKCSQCKSIFGIDKEICPNCSKELEIKINNKDICQYPKHKFLKKEVKKDGCKTMD